ncbi:MAG: MBL fold metallo-hydrolase, partial [Anaerolineae bacterium]|nr:MBL fold metallo-hydrolase [Anaerolineae bacterium]
MSDKVLFTVVNIGSLSINKFWGETKVSRKGTSATCTLLKSHGYNLLVDPSPYPEVLSKKLFFTTGLKPDQIDMVFLTHYHMDHRYGLELFPDAEWM